MVTSSQNKHVQWRKRCDKKRHGSCYQQKRKKERKKRTSTNITSFYCLPRVKTNTHAVVLSQVQTKPQLPEKSDTKQRVDHYMSVTFYKEPFQSFKFHFYVSRTRVKLGPPRPSSVSVLCNDHFSHCWLKDADLYRHCFSVCTHKISSNKSEMES